MACAFGASAFVALATSCGRTEIVSFEDRVLDAGTSCLPECQAVAGDLESLGVVAPCTEPAWSETAASCEACRELFRAFYSVELNSLGCVVCLPDNRKQPVCGIPPPSCPEGMRPVILDCAIDPCGECGPTYSGGCEPCPL